MKKLTDHLQSVFGIDVWLLQQAEKILELRLPVVWEVSCCEIDEDQRKFVEQNGGAKHDMLVVLTSVIRSDEVHEGLMRDLHCVLSILGLRLLHLRRVLVHFCNLFDRVKHPELLHHGFLGVLGAQ
jgi:hypothetical protein